VKNSIETGSESGTVSSNVADAALAGTPLVEPVDPEYRLVNEPDAVPITTG